MKKIGILYGRDHSFPEAFINRVNEIAGDEFRAEHVIIDKIFQNEALNYAVIVDRVSQKVPFYRAALKNAASLGTAVLNNPLLVGAQDNFFHNTLAAKLGIPVPKTALLPSYELPADTTDDSFINLAFPLDWESIFEHTGFPAYMKPCYAGEWKEVYKLHSKEDFFDKHGQTKQTVMMLQEEIVFESYFRCYCIGAKYVHIMPYEPRNPFHLRYQANIPAPSAGLLEIMQDYTIKLNQYLGYDFNTVEFAVRDGIPYAIDFCNPVPDADLNSIGSENFNWIVENYARYAIEKAREQVKGLDKKRAPVRKSASNKTLIPKQTRPRKSSE